MKRTRGVSNPVSLFPFLAVLVSAMGALILLLLVVARQAQRSRDVERAEANVASPPMVVRPPLPPLPRIKPFEKVSLPIEAEPPPIVAPTMPTVPTLIDRRDELQRQLRDALAEIDDKKRRFAEIANRGEPEEARELADLSREMADAMSRLNQTLTSARQAAQTLDQQIAQRKEIEQELARLASAVVDNRYRIIPYFGATGTDRRPIYLECRSDRIVLMPEGVEIDAGLLSDPSSPDNALAQMVRELSDLCRSERSRPYPLLVVRPQGVAAYYVARMALATVEDEYGYELVDEDVALDYGEASVKWRETAEASVAKQKRRGLASGGRAFSLASTLPPGVLGGSSNKEPMNRGSEGGKTLKGGDATVGKTSLVDRGSGSAYKKALEEAGRGLAPLDDPSSPGRNGLAIPDPPLPEAVALTSDGNSAMTGFEDPLLGGDQGTGNEVDASGRARSGNRSSRQGEPSETSLNGDPSNEQEIAVVPRPLQAGSVALTPAKGKAAGSTAVSPVTEFEQFLAANAKRGDKSIGDAPAGAVRAPDSADSDIDGQGGGSGSAPPSLSSNQAQSVLEMMGPTVRTHSAIARRVIVEVREHGVVLHPGDRYVAFDAAMRSTKEAIYSHVADQMSSWGKPKRADRWTPIVEFNVRPDGLERYYDLLFALAGSGLEVERRLVGWKDSLEFQR